MVLFWRGNHAGDVYSVFLRLKFWETGSQSFERDNSPKLRHRKNFLLDRPNELIFAALWFFAMANMMAHSVSADRFKFCSDWDSPKLQRSASCSEKKTGHRVGGTCWVGIWPGTPADQRVVEIGGGFLVKIERKRQKTNFWTKKGNLCSVGFSGAEFCPGEAQKTRRHLKWRPESQQHAHNLFGAQSSPQLEKRRFVAARPRNSPKTAQFWHGFRKSAISRAHVHEFFIWKLFWVSDFIRDHAATICPLLLVVTFSNLSTDLWRLIQGVS